MFSYIENVYHTIIKKIHGIDEMFGKKEDWFSNFGRSFITIQCQP